MLRSALSSGFSFDWVFSVFSSVLFAALYAQGVKTCDARAVLVKKFLR
jgi:hypothetical protein